jgi:hypothetical protein
MSRSSPIQGFFTKDKKMQVTIPVKKSNTAIKLPFHKNEEIGSLIIPEELAEKIIQLALKKVILPQLSVAIYKGAHGTKLDSVAISWEPAKKKSKAGR